MTNKEMIDRLEKLARSLSLDADNKDYHFTHGILHSIDSIKCLIDELKGEKKCSKSR